MAEALDEVETIAPQLAETDSMLYFNLHVLQYIEMVRRNEIMEAVQFAKEKLKPLCADSQCCLETVQVRCWPCYPCFV